MVITSLSMLSSSTKPQFLQSKQQFQSQCGSCMHSAKL